MFAQALRKPVGASDLGTLGGPRRREVRFRVWERVRIPRVSTDFVGTVQEESHIREFPNGITANLARGVAKTYHPLLAPGRARDVPCAVGEVRGGGEAPRHLH